MAKRYLPDKDKTSDPTRPHRERLSRLAARAEEDTGKGIPELPFEHGSGIFWGVVGMIAYLLGRGGQGKTRTYVGAGCGCVIIAILLAAGAIALLLQNVVR
jgi:hypothetical protein